MTTKITQADSLACKKFYDAASPEVLKITTDKLNIWLEDCQNNILKQKCNYFESVSNFITILGLFITLITTLKVTQFTSELWKAIYIVVSFIIFIILLYFVMFLKKLIKIAILRKLANA
jgi:hypothetical protein